MSIEQAREIFKKFILNDIYIDLQNGSIVRIETFVNMFNANPTYANLIAIDGGIKGYEDFFGLCKAEGILV